jgi:tetratricopeptide (TPR) repeat protein/O-antigen ligase
MKSSNTFLKNSVIGLLFLVPIFPLIVANSYFFPFITGKAFAFRIVVELAFALWLILLYKDRKYAPRWNSMTILVTVFTFAVLIADLLGVNAIRSIWSNNERMEGWLTIVHLWAYFILLTSMFRDKKWWPRYFNMTIAVAVIISLYGIAQMAGWAQIHQSASRLDASLGNSAYLAIYMLIHAFLAAYLAALAWQNKKIDRVCIYSALTALFTFILFETQTRGSQLGIIGGAALACFLYAIFARGADHKKARLINGGIVVLIILLGIGFYFGRNNSWIKGSAMFGRLASISLSDTTTISRLNYIWPMAIKGTFSSPKTAVIGYGQENFNYLFNAGYSPHMYNDEQWFDRAHNVFLDWLVDGGLVAFLLYISFYFLSIWYIWKSSMTTAEKSILTGLLAGYAVHNLFVFDNMASYYLFFLFLAFVSSMRESKGFAWLEKLSKNDEVANYVILPFAAILFVLVLYFINIRPIQANTDIIAALENCGGQQGVLPTVVLWQKALDVNAYVANQEIREQLLSCADNVISSQSIDNSTKSAFFSLVNTEVQKQVKATPNDARIYTLAGGFYNDIGQWSQAQPLLIKAHQLSPGKQAIDFELGLNYLNTASTTAGVALFKQAYESDTTYPDAAINYAAALIATGDEADAAPLLAANPAAQTDNRIINAYVAEKNYTKVISIYKTLVAQNPSSVQDRVSLAATYYQEKDIYDAKATINQAIKDFPLYKDQLGQLLTQIENPTPAVSATATQ